MLSGLRTTGVPVNVRGESLLNEYRSFASRGIDGEPVGVHGERETKAKGKANQSSARKTAKVRLVSISCYSRL